MGNKAIELSALAVKAITRRGATFVGGVPGLALVVHASGTRSWVLRYKISGIRRDMGLGSYDDVSLANARVAARAARAKISAGIDPIQERKTTRSALIAEMAKALTFSECATKYIETHESGWRNAKHAQQWRTTIERYANPVIGKMLVRDVRLPHILNVLEPIWHQKTETASRLRGRLESVLDWAAVREYRTGPNPARWKGHLDTLLAEPGKIAKTSHHRALFGKLIDRIKARERKVASRYLIAKPDGTPLNQWTLRTRFDDARAVAAKEAKDAGNEELADKIRAFQFRDIRPKAASEMKLAHASELLGHTEQEITKKVYQRVGQLVKPTK